jgi:hypothetical protein
MHFDCCSGGAASRLFVYFLVVQVDTRYEPVHLIAKQPHVWNSKSAVSIAEIFGNFLVSGCLLDEKLSTRLTRLTPHHSTAPTRNAKAASRKAGRAKSKPKQRQPATQPPPPGHRRWHKGSLMCSLRTTIRLPRTIVYCSQPVDSSSLPKLWKHTTKYGKLLIHNCPIILAACRSPST